MNKRTVIIAIVIIGIVPLIIPLSGAILKSFGGSSKTVTTAEWDVALNQTGISSNVSTTVGSANGTDYTLRLVSDSEVDVTYSITISNIPTGVVVKINGESFQTPLNGTVTFTDAGTINYTGSPVEVTRTITFKATAEATLVNAQQVAINVDFKQSI